jgi:TATA-box binding protein (TBP) (component of TFIID and TFIIIB)
MKYSLLPKNVNISTMTMTGRFDTEFCLENIGQYLTLKSDGIVEVKYGSGESMIHRSLIKPKKSTSSKKKKTAKKSGKKFQNQITIRICIYPERNKMVSVKLFRNGSIQAAGCNSIETISIMLEKLCKAINMKKAVIVYKGEKKITKKPFATKLANVVPKKAQDLKIVMINSGFAVNFKIDRENLYNILLLKNVDCTYDPIIHAGVNIRYFHKGLKKVTIFVFESGNIIITGGINCGQIRGAFEFICDILERNYDDVIKVDISEIDDSKILSIMNSL